MPSIVYAGTTTYNVNQVLPYYASYSDGSGTLYKINTSNNININTIDTNYDAILQNIKLGPINNYHSTYSGYTCSISSMQLSGVTCGYSNSPYDQLNWSNDHMYDTTYLQNYASGLTTAAYSIIKYGTGTHGINVGTIDTTISLNSTYLKYFIDSYTYYVDSYGYVHFVITQNSPNSVCSYAIINNTTGQRYGIGGQWGTTFELVDTNPKVGAANNYSLAISCSSLGYTFYGTVYGHIQYTNVLVLVPGDPATYGVLTQGKNNNGKSLDATYDQASAANLSSQQAKVSADNAYGATYNANGNTITAVRDASGTVLSEARQAKNQAVDANTKLDSLTTSINNMQNTIGSDTAAPVVTLKTVSGARATSGNSIKVGVNASDNGSATFTYSLDGVVYYPLPTDGVINVPVLATGENYITVWVKDKVGNTGRDSITIRKL